MIVLLKIRLFIGVISKNKVLCNRVVTVAVAQGHGGFSLLYLVCYIYDINIEF